MSLSDLRTKFRSPGVIEANKEARAAEPSSLPMTLEKDCNKRFHFNAVFLNIALESRNIPFHVYPDPSYTECSIICKSTRCLINVQLDLCGSTRSIFV